MQKLLRPVTVAQILDIPIGRFYSLARKGLIPTVRVGRQIRVEEEELKKWIKNGGKPLYEEG